MGHRGALIVIEGLDRSGKSTQCKKLLNALKHDGHKVKGLKFPDRTTEIGKVINSYLQNRKEIDDHAIHLLFSANTWEQSAEILDSLNNGVTLVVDRYAYSGAAYTGAKKGFCLDWCMKCDSGLPEPDLVFFLNLSASDAEKRGGYGEERYEKKEFQEQVHKNFLELKTKQWKVIDASQSLENVHNQLLTATNDLLSEINLKPIGKLWSDC